MVAKAQIWYRPALAVMLRTMCMYRLCMGSHGPVQVPRNICQFTGFSSSFTRVELYAGLGALFQVYPSVRVIVGGDTKITYRTRPKNFHGLVLGLHDQL
jgi:hypothetical protein